MEQVEKDVYWINKAISLAKIAKEQGEIPVGAVLIYEDKLIAEGYNHPIFDHDPCGHAEIFVLRTGGKYLQNYRLYDTTLYVTLEPCIMCAGAMIHARISRLVYGAYDKKRGSVSTAFDIFNHSDINHRILVVGGVLADECSTLLRCFFKSRRLEQC